MPIQFGTDGWRAVISDTFTFQNLRQVTQAIADAVASDEWLNNSHSGPKPDPRRMVVGFDTRFLSDRYAVEASRVLAANGYKVYLTSADIPTPAVSYSVQHLGAIAGLMITASHNAPRYNGVKLKAAYGGSAVSEQCRRVEVYLNDNEARGRGPNLMDYEQARDVGLIERFNPTPSYYDHLRTLIDFDAIADNPQHLVVDSMFGSEDLQFSEGAGPQHRSKLHREELGLSEAEPYGPQSEGGVNLMIVPVIGEEFITTDIQGPDDDRSRGHPFNNPLIGVELFFLRGRILAIQVEEFRTIEPDPVCPLTDGHGNFLCQLDICPHSNPIAISGLRGERRIFEHLPLQESDLFLFFTIFLRGRLIGIDDDRSRISVDNQEVSPIDHGGGSLQPDHGGNSQ